MRGVHVALAGSVALNVAAGVGWWTARAPAEPVAEERAEATTGAEEVPDTEEVTGAPESPSAVAARAARSGDLAPDAAAPRPPPTGSPAAPTLDQLLGRPATSAERAEYAEFLRNRAAALPASYASVVAAREQKARLEADAARVAEEDARRGGPVEFLRRRAEQGGEVIPEFVRGPEFERWFVPTLSGKQFPVAPDRAPPETLVAGDEVAFAAGAHRFSVRRWSHQPFPADLVVTGAGRDATIVTFDEFQTPSTAVLGLTFRDLTVDCGNNYLMDLRNQDPVVLRFERCRLIRFDMGAGGSVALQTGPLAVRMTDCVVETGFGRSPPHGHLFRCSGPILGRMERTVFRGVHVGSGGSGSVLTLDGCTVEEMDEDALRAWKADWIRASDTTFSAAASSDRKTRPLSELNAAWSSVR